MAEMDPRPLTSLVGDNLAVIANRAVAAAAAQSVDRQACQRERIHAPGAIQPHGALIAAFW